MKFAIQGARLINGDGYSDVPNSLILINQGIIEYAGKRKDIPLGYSIHNAEECIVMPGIINTHTHGVIYGTPLFSSGSKPLTNEQVTKNIRKHLSQGTTTIVGVDGFALLDDIEKTNLDSPITVYSTLTRTPKSYSSAKLVDGAGIRKQPLGETDFNHPLIVGLGEGGSGATLGGGVQDYKFIPTAIKKRYGLDISEEEANALKIAILGREIRTENYDPRKLNELMITLGLNTTNDELVNLIQNCVLPPFEDSVQSIIELYQQSQRADLPLVVHSAAPSIETIDALIGDINIKRGRLIAGHSNHPSYSLDEAIDNARRLKAKGVTIDISTFDTGNTHDETELHYFNEMLRLGLVDTITTDYGGGDHSGILELLKLAIDNGAVSLQEGIRLATSNPAKAMPKIFSRGLIKPKQVADIILVDKEDISQVKKVFSRGNLVYQN